MRHKTKPKLLVVVALLITFSSPGNARDSGNLKGDPTPAMAMYAAQTTFAAEKCVTDGFTADEKGAASLVKYFNRVARIRLYNKKHPDFVRNLESFLDTYSVAWSTADGGTRQKFCSGFNDEIAVKSEGLIPWVTPIEYFRRQFSPPSLADAERLRRLASFATALSAVATTASAAASISAGQDAVSSAKAGDFSASNQSMATSKSFTQLGAGFVDISALVGYEGANAAASVLEEQRSDGTVRIVRCPVVDHFFSYSAPVDSPIWLDYQKVSMPCRDFEESDLENVE